MQLKHNEHLFNYLKSITSLPCHQVNRCNTLSVLAVGFGFGSRGGHIVLVAQAGVKTRPEVQFLLFIQHIRTYVLFQYFAFVYIQKCFKMQLLPFAFCARIYFTLVCTHICSKSQQCPANCISHYFMKPMQPLSRVKN